MHYFYITLDITIAILSYYVCGSKTIILETENDKKNYLAKYDGRRTFEWFINIISFENKRVWQLILEEIKSMTNLLIRRFKEFIFNYIIQCNIVLNKFTLVFSSKTIRLHNTVSVSKRATAS